MANFTRTYYENYVFPLWADSLGWLIGLSTLAPLFIMAGYLWWRGEYVSNNRHVGVNCLLKLIGSNQFVYLFIITVWDRVVQAVRLETAELEDGQSINP